MSATPTRTSTRATSAVPAATGAQRPAGVKPSKMHNVILAAASGTLLAIAFPYPSLWPLAWVGLVPLLVVLSQRRFLAGLGLGYVFGLFFFGITLRWSAELDPPGSEVLWILFVLIEAVILALTGALAAWLLRGRAGLWWRPWAVASAWTLIEAMRVAGRYGLTWSQLSYSQLPSRVVVQMADVTGAIGVTFVIVLVNAVLADLVLWREQNRGVALPAAMRQTALLSGALVTVCLAYGAIRYFTLPAVGTEASVIACVQPNDDPHRKWDPNGFREHLVELLKHLEQATDRAAAQGAVLVVWPETVFPRALLPASNVDDERDLLLGRIQAIARRLRVYILVGAAESSPPHHVYNTAFLLDPNGAIQGRYDKIHLVPFGEFLPLRSVLQKIPPFDTVPDLTPGTDLTVFHTDRFSFATLICFESTFSDLPRAFVRKGAQLLVVITNDGWFNRTSAAEHHLAMSAMRAIEERIWVIQCGNTGVTAFVDPRGGYHQKTELFVPAVTTMAIPTGTNGSVYQRFGDWFLGVTAMLFAGCLVLRLRSA